jgi:P27 family predicted phage terminase small subunit
LRLIRGNPGRRPLPKDEAEIPAGIPAPPDYLNSEAIKQWEKYAPDLEQVGLLTKIDGPALGILCDLYAEIKKASAKIKKEGAVIKTLYGPKRNPWVDILNKARELAMKMQSEFGMTPSSRSRVKAAPKKEKKTEGEDYFGWAEKKA